MKRKAILLATLLFSVTWPTVGCDWQPYFTNQDIQQAELGKGLPQGFLLGTATAAHQVEGGNDNDWTTWEKGAFPCCPSECCQGKPAGILVCEPNFKQRNPCYCVPSGQTCSGTRPHIRDNHQSGTAANSWNLWKEDIKLLQELGVNAYRLGIEWSRIEPEKGKWNQVAIDRYREILLELKAKNIKAMVTLYHFTLPQWFAQKGGWEIEKNKDALTDFESYAKKAGEAFGDLVDLWATINEPNVLAFEGYVFGEWPPGVKDDLQTAAKVMATLFKAHAHAARGLRAGDTQDADGDGKATQIGIVHHVRISEPASSFLLDTMITSLTDEFFNESTAIAVARGKIYLSIPGDLTIDESYDLLTGEGKSDFLGINYYTRDRIRTDLGDPSLSVQYTPKDRPLNDLKWDIYPEGLYSTLMKFSRYGLPIYITENGTADQQDTIRPQFLRSHFYAMQKAIEHGADIRGYFHWSLIDNYEWAQGYNGNFGLYSVDRSHANFTRTPRKESVELFQQIARNLGLSPIPR